MVFHREKDLLAGTYRAAGNHMEAASETPLAVADDGALVCDRNGLLAQPHPCHYPCHGSLRLT